MMPSYSVFVRIRSMGMESGQKENVGHSFFNIEDNTYELLRSQRNQLFAGIKDQGLDPFVFRWEKELSPVDGETMVPKLVYNDALFWFLFDLREGKQYVAFSPGNETPIEHEHSGSWKRVLQKFLNWLGYLKRETDEPDFWEQVSLFSKPSGFRTPSDEVNSHFSVVEAKQIENGLADILKYVKATVSISSAQTVYLEDRLGYLEKAISRLGRLDWLHSCIGVIGSMIASLALAPENQTAIWQIIKGSLTGIVRLLPGP